RRSLLRRGEPHAVANAAGVRGCGDWLTQRQQHHESEQQHSPHNPPNALPSERKLGTLAPTVPSREKLRFWGSPESWRRRASQAHGKRHSDRTIGGDQTRTYCMEPSCRARPLSSRIVRVEVT